MRVYLGAPAVDGIARVSEALRAGLPEHGILVVDTPDAADVIALHGADRAPITTQPLIAHCHGLMWQSYPWRNRALADEINARVIDNLIRATAITAPSRWVAHALSRGLLRHPTVIYHGVDTEVWTPSQKHDTYVLWNKARCDEVSNPAPLDAVAARLPGETFVTTFGQAAPNVRVIGPQPYTVMHETIRHAGVYLATTRETFGIGTLEALACGVPVVGYDFGGQREIIRDGETGYLVTPGDDAALADAIVRARHERKRLSRNAREDAVTRWQWPDKIAQYATLYWTAYHADRVTQPPVSVVITCHNLERFLPDAVRSVQEQSVTTEIIIVDDASTTPVMPIPGTLLLRPNENLGLSAARNYGAAQATGRYILFLDADDMLAPDSLAPLVAALDTDAGIHIAYGSMTLMHEDGSDAGDGGAWPRAFVWEEQLAHLNQLTYCALLRRAVLVETGGYRMRHWRAEDAALWCRATSFGFRAAKVTERAVLCYRLRADSKSQQERAQYEDIDGPWTAEYPWATAHSATDGLRARHDQRTRPVRSLVPFGAQGDPAPRRAWDVPHYEHPLISVIIPVGPGHAPYVIDALDSLIAQDLQAWEAIVVNDTGEPLAVAGAPYAQVVSTGGQTGPGNARNVGLAVARAPLTLFLDADDWLVPGSLRVLLERYAHGDAGYVYSDWLAVEGRTVTPHTSDVATPDRLLQGLSHPVTVLIATDDAVQVGFDAAIRGWEDWEFFLRATIVHGICGERVALPLLAYRLQTGTMRQKSQDERAAILDDLKTRYRDYTGGTTPMATCCGGNADALLAAKAALNPSQTDTEEFIPTQPGNVVLEYVGQYEAPVTYHVHGRTYKGGRALLHRYAEVPQDDVQALLDLGVWQVTAPATPEPLAPDVEEPVVTRRRRRA